MSDRKYYAVSTLLIVSVMLATCSGTVLLGGLL